MRVIYVSDILIQVDLNREMKAFKTLYQNKGGSQIQIIDYLAKSEYFPLQKLNY
jgi:hypothetical protein